MADSYIDLRLKENDIKLKTIDNGDGTYKLDVNASVTAGATTVPDGNDVAQGTTTDSAVVTDTSGTVIGFLRGLVKWAFERMPASLGQKEEVKSFWEDHPCEARYAKGLLSGDFFRATEEARYSVNSDVRNFAEFSKYEAAKVLEIGTGIGVDHLSWHRAAADIYGIDLTEQDDLKPAKAVILAVPHKEYLQDDWGFISKLLENNSGVVFDVKSVLSREARPKQIELYRL